MVSVGNSRWETTTINPRLGLLSTDFGGVRAGLHRQGLANACIATRVGVSPATVRAWRARFAQEGLAKLGTVRPGRGRKSTIPQTKIHEIVELTRHSKPAGQTHWSCRTMAQRVGVSPATVQRVWAARGLKPHLVHAFKLSNDPRFEEKLIDVVGLYVNPPERAIVLCLDEKSSVQALDRTQPSLPMVKGRAATMTHDYKRHGTTTLFAALDVLHGGVIGECLPRHRHTEFLRFLKTIHREVPKGLDSRSMRPGHRHATTIHRNATALIGKHAGRVVAQFVERYGCEEVAELLSEDVEDRTGGEVERAVGRPVQRDGRFSCETGSVPPHGGGER